MWFDCICSPIVLKNNANDQFFADASSNGNTLKNPVAEEIISQLPSLVNHLSHS
jgi:hypothetical protein